MCFSMPSTRRTTRKATEQINELRRKADDFDATKAQAAVAAFTRASDMQIMMAKNHLAAKDMEKAQGAIRSAMEIWPQKPQAGRI